MAPFDDSGNRYYDNRRGSDPDGQGSITVPSESERSTQCAHSIARRYRKQRNCHGARLRKVVYGLRQEKSGGRYKKPRIPDSSEVGPSDELRQERHNQWSSLCGTECWRPSLAARVIPRVVTDVVQNLPGCTKEEQKKHNRGNGVR